MNNLQKMSMLLLLGIVFSNSTVYGQQKAHLDPYLNLIQRTSEGAKFQSKQILTNNELKTNVTIYQKRHALKSLYDKFNLDIENKEETVGVILEFTGNRQDLLDIGIKIRSDFGKFITADIPINKITTAQNLSGMKAIELGKPVVREMDASRSMIGADAAHNIFPQRGEDIIIGIIDTGIDYTHPAFQTSNGSSTRILSLWDQTLTPSSPPPGFDYGKYYTQSQLNSPGLPTEDLQGHGTHIAGIAAGNGKDDAGNQTSYYGIAPESDLIIVKADITDENDNPFVTFSDKVLDGIKFISDRAKQANKSWVINLSLSMNYGPRNGTSLFERTIAEIINTPSFGKGRIIVTAAGNNYYSGSNPNPVNKNHSHADSDDIKAFDVDILQNQTNVNNSVQMEIYYPPTSNYEVKLVSPSGTIYGPVAVGELFSGTDNTEDGFVFIDNNSDGDIIYEGADNIVLISLSDYDSDGDNNVDDHLEAGQWTLYMENSTGHWDAYVQGFSDLNEEAYFSFDFSNNHNFNEPANVANIITVGSVNSKNSWVGINGSFSDPTTTIGDISHFSSRGQTRAGVVKPDYYAPGAYIASVLSRDNPGLKHLNLMSSNSSYVHLSGTSMSAPHVAGTIALLLEKWNIDNGENYSHPEIVNILNRSKSANDLINVEHALMIDEIVTGLEDNVKFSSSCSGGNLDIIEPDVSNKYCADFVDESPYGDYGVSYNWKLEAINSQTGNVVLLSHNTGSGSNSQWTFTLQSSTLENQNWIRDDNENIKAIVTITCTDNDGVTHTDNKIIGIKYIPNKPIISNHTRNGSSIDLDFLAGGASSYKVHYGTSSGAPYNGTGANEGSSPINVGSTTSYTLSGLDFDNNIYYFAITATNSEGESPYSDEIRVGDVYELVWMDLDGVKANGNSLTKSRIRNNWYEGVASFNELPPNTDGWIEMTAVENNTYRMFGLSNFNEDASWNTIDYNFYVRANGTIQIYESGSLKCNCGNYSAGDKIQVERQGSQILYKLNGNTIYTSSCDPSESLIADVSLYSISATISNAIASFPASNTEPYEVEWTDLVKVYVDNNSLTRDDSYRGWNAGAATINRLPTWTDGWIETTVQETNSYRMFGLSSDNSDPNWNTIDYNMYLRQDGKLYIYESGSYIGNFGNYNSGDLIKVERVDDNILYKKNGQTLHTSSCDPSTPLIGDVSMYSPSSTLYDVVSSFRRYDQYITQLQSVTALQPEDDFFVDPTIVSTDSVINESKSVVNSKSTISNTIANEAILSDSTNYNPLGEIKINPNPTTGRINLSYS